jgi:hypothetical protein
MTPGAGGWVISRPSCDPPRVALTPKHSVHHARSRRTYPSANSLKTPTERTKVSLRSTGQLRDAHVRDAKRRGHGWTAGCAEVGWSNSLGWYEGFRLLTAVDPTGVITGLCFCAASTAEQSRRPKPSSPPEPGRTPDSEAWARPPRYPTWSTRASRGQITTSGGSGATERSLALRAQTQRPRGVAQAFEALGSGDPPDRRELLYDKLFNTFGLWRERPHQLQGLRARLAARVALHNFCIWLNGQLGCPRLAFADLLGW